MISFLETPRVKNSLIYRCVRSNELLRTEKNPAGLGVKADHCVAAMNGVAVNLVQTQAALAHIVLILVALAGTLVPRPQALLVGTLVSQLTQALLAPVGTLVPRLTQALLALVGTLVPQQMPIPKTVLPLAGTLVHQARVVIYKRPPPRIGGL